MQLITAVLTRPAYVTYGLILLTVLVFLAQTRLPVGELGQMFYQLAVVPCQFVAGFAPVQLVDMLRSMFIHADVWHLLGNMTFLWIFGTNVEDYMGRKRFLVFYVLGGAVAALTHILLYSHECRPLIGASGAVSAVLGAYIILYPGTRVRVGIPFLRIFMLPLTVPAWLMLGVWFLLQIVSGTAALASAGSVAFFAHIGGFVFGLVWAFIYMLIKGAPETIIYPD